jgi:hypothetical protein
VHSDPSDTIRFQLRQGETTQQRRIAHGCNVTNPTLPISKLHRSDYETRSKQGLSVRRGCQVVFTSAKLRNELSGFNKCGEFLDWLKIYSLLKDCPHACTVVPPYSRVIRSKTYRGYVKPRIIPNAICNDIRVTYINTVKFN